MDNKQKFDYSCVSIVNFFSRDCITSFKENAVYCKLTLYMNTPSPFSQTGTGQPAPIPAPSSAPW